MRLTSRSAGKRNLDAQTLQADAFLAANARRRARVPNAVRERMLSELADSLRMKGPLCAERVGAPPEVSLGVWTGLRLAPCH